MAHGHIQASVSGCTEPSLVVNINGVDFPVERQTDVITRIAEEHALGHVLSELEFQYERLTEENAALQARLDDARGGLKTIDDMCEKAHLLFAPAMDWQLIINIQAAITDIEEVAEALIVKTEEK